MNSWIVGVDRRREARIEDAAFPRRDGEALQQSAAHIHLRVDQRDDAIGAGRLHQRRAGICRALGLAGGGGEIERGLVPPLVCPPTVSPPPLSPAAAPLAETP